MGSENRRRSRAAWVLVVSTLCLLVPVAGVAQPDDDGDGAGTGETTTTSETTTTTSGPAPLPLPTAPTTTTTTSPPPTEAPTTTRPPETTTTTAPSVTEEPSPTTIPEETTTTAEPDATTTTERRELDPGGPLDIGPDGPDGAEAGRGEPLSTGTLVALTIGGLLGFAGVLAAVTYWYWKRTRPVGPSPA